MVTRTRGAMKGRRMRATRLDGCGRPVYGEDSQATSKGFVSVAWTANTVDTEEVSQTNASGERCLYEPAETELTGYTAVISFCEVDPELFSLITGQEVYLNATGEAIGFSINTDIQLSDRGFALEVWAGAPSGDACSDPNAQGEYGYFLAPFLKGGIIGDYTIENGAVTFTIQGATTRDGNQWGTGPYAVIDGGTGTPGPLPTPLKANDHKLMIWVDVAPPEAVPGWRPLMDPDVAPITAVAAIEGASPMEANFTFTGATATPVYIEFGDGEWDYVADGTTGSSHVYTETGTYTVTATSNGTKVTTQVVVPFS